MPTMPERKAFAQQAAEQFLGQTLHRCQDLVLLVVSPRADILGLPDDERIVRISLPRDVKPLGAKRNLCCACARSEWIAHWDDDDWRAPDYLEALFDSGRDRAVCARSSAWFDTGTEAWLYLGGPTYGIGSTLLYRRAWWERHVFPDMQIGEDHAFILSACANQQAILVPLRSDFVARDHGANTSPRNRKQSILWKQYPRSALPQPYLRLSETIK